MELWKRTYKCEKCDNELDRVRDLLKQGVDVNVKDRNGKTALMEATRHGHADVVRLLLDKGSDVNAKDNEGRSPLDLATAGDYTEIVELLQKHIAGRE